MSYGADDLDDEDESKDMEEDEAKDSDDSRDYNINTQVSLKPFTSCCCWLTLQK